MRRAVQVGRGDLVLIAVAVAAVSTSAPLIREAEAPALAIAFWRNALAVADPGAAVRRSAAGRDRRTGSDGGGRLPAGRGVPVGPLRHLGAEPVVHHRGVVGCARGHPAGVGGAAGPGPRGPCSRPGLAGHRRGGRRGRDADRGGRGALLPGPRRRPPRPGRRDPRRRLRDRRRRGPPDGLDHPLHRPSATRPLPIALGLACLGGGVGPLRLRRPHLGVPAGAHRRPPAPRPFGGQPGAAHDERHGGVGGHPLRDRRFDPPRLGRLRRERHPPAPIRPRC